MDRPNDPTTLPVLPEATLYSITFHFVTTADIEKVKDLAEQMIDSVNPDFGYFSAIKVTICD